MKDNLLILLIVIGVGWLFINADRPETAVTTQPVIERVETIVETVQVIVTSPPVVLEPAYEPEQPVATVEVISINSVVMTATPIPTSTAVGLELRLIQAGANKVADCVREGAANGLTGECEQILDFVKAHRDDLRSAYMTIGGAELEQ